MFGGMGLMNAVLTIRPDTKQLRKDLEEEVPKAVRSAAKKAEPVAERGFKKVGKEGGDALAAELKKGQAAGLKLDPNGKWRNAKGEYASAGELLGAGLTTGLKKSVDKGLAASMTNIGNKMSNAGSKMIGTGALMTAGMTAPLVMLGKASADVAIAYQDALGANEQLFGKEGLAVLQRFEDKKAEALQIPKAQVQTIATGLSGYMAAFGAGADQAEATTKLMERLADTTAMYGGNIQDKAMAVQAMLRGEYDPMETAFPGASVKQSDVVARAAEMGLLTVNVAELNKAKAVLAERTEKVNRLQREGKAGTVEHNKAVADAALAQQKLDEVAQGADDSLTTEARTMAALSLFYEQTAKAEGQINREREGASGQIREMTMQWENMKLTLGQELLPVIAEVAPKLADMIKRMSENGTFERMIPAIESLANTIVDLLDKFTKLPPAVQQAALGFALFGGPVTSATGGLLKLVGGGAKAVGWLAKLGGTGRAAAGGVSAVTAASGSATTGISGMTAAAGTANGMSFGGLLGSLGAVSGAVAAIGAGIAGWFAGMWIGDRIFESGWGKELARGAANFAPTRWLIGGIAKLTGDDRRVISHDSGGVHPGPFGVHTPAMVAGGEIVLPTHRYPVAEAAARVGLGGMLGGQQTFAPSVTNHIYAAPGMDVNALAAKTSAVTGEALDQVTRRAAARTMRPAQNRRV